MLGLWKGPPGKTHYEVFENWISTTLLLSPPSMPTRMCKVIRKRRSWHSRTNGGWAVAVGRFVGQQMSAETSKKKTAAWQLWTWSDWACVNGALVYADIYITLFKRLWEIYGTTKEEKKKGFLFAKTRSAACLHWCRVLLWNNCIGESNFISYSKHRNSEG